MLVKSGVGEEWVGSEPIEFSGIEVGPRDVERCGEEEGAWWICFEVLLRLSKFDKKERGRKSEGDIKAEKR